MTSEETNIQNFKSLNDLNSFIDDNAYALYRDRDLLDVWVKFKKWTSKKDEKKKSQWEIECFGFTPIGSSFFSQVYSQGKDPAEITQYPDLTKIQIAAYKYIKKRSIEAKMPILRARYYHILWCAPKGLKNRTDALMAIENYITAIRKFYTLFQTERDEKNLTRVNELYEALNGLTHEIKSINNTKSLTQFLLFEAPGISFHTKHFILKNMLRYPDVYKPDDFAKTLTIFDDKLSSEKDRADDYFLAQVYFETAIRIAVKIKSDVRRWHTEKGLAYMRIAAGETKQDRLWLNMNTYSKAIEAFTLAGNKAKKKEAEKLYAELKPKITLSSYRVNYDQKTRKILKEHDETLKQKGAEKLKLSPEEIYAFISRGHFFPKHADVLAAAKANKHNVFLNFATTLFFDDNKNVSQQKLDSNRDIFDLYQSYIKHTTLPYLNYILITGIKSGHLTPKNFISYLYDKTWIGKPRVTRDLSGKERKSDWIELLGPSIIDFFINVQAWGSSDYFRPNFVLSIDSLTLKMEGLFRDFSERVQVPTSVNRKSEMQEVYIHQVLENEEIRKYFNDDDTLFFNFLFKNEGGLNLRNNVAHCFYAAKHYSPDLMLLLIAALFRIAKYDAKPVK